MKLVVNKRNLRFIVSLLIAILLIGLFFSRAFVIVTLTPIIKVVNIDYLQIKYTVNVINFSPFNLMVWEKNFQGAGICQFIYNDFKNVYQENPHRHTMNEWIPLRKEVQDKVTQKFIEEWTEIVKPFHVYKYNNQINIEIIRYKYYVYIDMKKYLDLGKFVIVTYYDDHRLTFPPQIDYEKNLFKLWKKHNGKKFNTYFTVPKNKILIPSVVIIR